MNRIELFVLTLLETSAITLLWSKLEVRLQKQLWKRIIFVITLSLFAVFVDHYQITGGNFLNFIFTIIAICRVFKISILESFFQFCAVIIMTITIQLLFSVPLSFINNIEMYTFQDAVVVNVLFLITSIIIWRFIPLQNIKKVYEKNRKLASFIMINSVSLVTLVFSLWQLNERYIWENILIVVFILLVWIGINIFLFFNFVKFYDQKKKLELHEQYIPVVESLMDEVRRKQHDFKNHLHVIYGLIENTDEKDLKIQLKGYLSSLLDSLSLSDLAVKIPNPILGGILYSKKCEAEINHIDFYYTIRHDITDFPFQDYELSEVIGNLMDNALDELMHSSESKKEIVFNVGVEEDRRFIEVKNTGEPISSERIDKIFEKGYSTKKGKHQGYGLYNVKKIVDRYKGTIELSQENEYISFKILF